MNNKIDSHSKIFKIIDKFASKPKKYSLEEAVEDYVVINDVYKSLSSIYTKLTAMFKEQKTLVIQGKRYSLVRKTSNISRFDKDAFIEDYGLEVYEKYQRTSIRNEYTIIPKRSKI